ncbi:hypothetical protein WICMUC_002018 [Wickerhamomyces mucosus]|uniref:AMP-dependent synthetase/ligase domain-containing protein n=1 Tax=Wickerhamomyces mucosus TaxID=1378264 RepID=A0A9P8PQU1_9ASCO|nr:hypothetical protein WICMUC_002018 [Wickerhamomyces mucosus]
MILQILGVLIFLYLLLFLYHEYLDSQRDINEIALNQQSNISPTRKEQESAIYRNNQTPHGMPLITGLQIRHGFRLRNGNLKDVWSVIFAQKEKSNRISINDSDAQYSLDINNLNGMIKGIANYFNQEGFEVIGTTLPLFSYHGFILALCCFFSGFTLHHFAQLPRVQPDVDVMIGYETDLLNIQRLKYKQIIVVSEDPDKKYEDDGVKGWSILGNLSELNEEQFKYEYAEKDDQGIPFRQTNQFLTHEYTHLNFVSSIAAIVKSIPIGKEIGPRDKILVTQSNDLKQFPKILATLLLGGSIVLNSLPISIKETIEIFKPTIVTLDPNSAKQFLENQVISGLQSLKLARSKHLLSEGIFSSSAALNGFESLRIVYLGNDQAKSQLSSDDLTTLRSLLGSRVLSERYISGALGSILNTNFYDYRIFSNDKLINRGTASLALELKLFQHKELPIEQRHGELCIRGFIIGKPVGENELQRVAKSGTKVGGEGWMPTGIIGKFGNDGCFYEDQ